MSSQSLNLVERAAQRLRENGALDAATAPLLTGEPTVHTLVPPAAPREATGDPGFSAATPAAAAPVLPISALERTGMIDWTKGRSRVSEEFRIVQGQIMRTAFAPQIPGKGLANLVMVTSARPGEGKSFASLNLALSIARQQDHAVLLVDTDAKDQSLGRALGLADTPGLLDLALDPQLDPDSLIATTGFDKLSVLPLGRHPEKSAELFATRQMTRLIRDLARRYADRVVILDAAPCLSSSDPSTLAPVVGQIVMVVEAERTQRSEVEAALDLVQACPTISLLLNKVQVTTSYTFGAYAYHHATS